MTVFRHHAALWRPCRWPSSWMEPCTTQQTNGKDDSATHNLWIGGAFLSQDPSVEVIEIDAFGRRQTWTNGV